MLRTEIYVHVYIILDFLITYRYTSWLCQSEYACLYKTVNMVVFFVKSNENTFPKGKSCPNNEKREYHYEKVKRIYLRNTRLVSFGENMIWQK